MADMSEAELDDWLQHLREHERDCQPGEL